MKPLKYCPMCTLPVKDHVDMMKWEMGEKGFPKEGKVGDGFLLR